MKAKVQSLWQKTTSKLSDKKTRRRSLVALAVVAVGLFFGVRWWMARADALPDGIASGNGRIESREVDVATRLPLRVREIFAEEGDLVRPGQVLVQMDTITLEQELAEAASSLAAAEEQRAVARAAIDRRQSEITLAQTEVERARALVAEHAGSQRELDVRTSALRTARAGLAEEQANLRVAEEQVQVAEASRAVIQSRIDDATLRSPVLGRVLYRLAEPGEVLGAGGEVLTLVSLEEVYMEIFLPAEQAAQLEVGAEARVRLDYASDRVAPASVSFVSPEAQFTPREVETESERETLMFRVKLELPRALVMAHLDRIKTGARGVGYVRLRDSVAWPEALQRTLPMPETSAPAIAK